MRGTGNACYLEYAGEVVRDDTAADELREDADEEDKPHPIEGWATVDENAIIPPALLRPLDLQSKRLLDFVAFESDDGRVRVSIAMILDENCTSLFGLVLGEEPSWTFWDEPDEAYDEQRWERLQDDGDSPGPVGGHESSPITCP